VSHPPPSRSVSPLQLLVVRVFPAREGNVLPWLQCVDAVINISVLFVSKNPNEDRILWLKCKAIPLQALTGP
jgi:hypothetical protein